VNYYRNMWAIIIFTSITLGAAKLVFINKRSFRAGTQSRSSSTCLMLFIPLALSVYLAENTFRLVKGMFLITTTIGKLFGNVREFAVSFQAINQIQILLILAGFIFTLWAGYLISKRLSKSEKELRQTIFAIGVTAIVYLLIGVKILTIPII
jgi:hypothetical protein